MAGDLQLNRKTLSKSRVLSLKAELAALQDDLLRLKNVNESSNLIEEMHFRFLARCRLLTIGKYQISGYIGSGNCGSVYRAFERTDPTNRVAIKVLFAARNKEESERFKREGIILHKLKHPLIVRGLTRPSFVEGSPVVWFAMELIEEAQTFATYLRTCSLGTACQVLAQVCDALAFAHAESIVHRDIHLGNILVRNDGDVKILDFGSARHGDDLETFKPVGAIRVTSPEALFDQATVGSASDIFSIGCLLYYTFARVWPFESENYGELVSRLERVEYSLNPISEPAVRNLLLETLVRDPSQRADALEVARQLRLIASHIG